MGPARALRARLGDQTRTPLRCRDPSTWGAERAAEELTHSPLRLPQFGTQVAPVWPGQPQRDPADNGDSRGGWGQQGHSPGLLSPRPGSDAAPRGGRGVLSPWDVAKAGRSEEEWPRSARGHGGMGLCRAINASPMDAKRAPSPSQPPSRPRSPRPVPSPQPCPIPGRWRRAVAAANITAD